MVVRDRKTKIVRLYRYNNLKKKSEGRRYVASAKNFKLLYAKYKLVNSYKHYSEFTYRDDSRQKVSTIGGLDPKRVSYKPRVSGLKNKQVIMLLTGFRKVSDSVGFTVEGYSGSFKSMKYFNEALDEAYVVCIAKLGFTPQKVIIHRIDIREFR